MSAYYPEIVSEAIKIAEETEFSIWASQKDHLTKKSNGRQPSYQKKSKAAKDDQQQQQQYQHSFEDQVQQTTDMTSTTRDLLRDIDDSLQKKFSNVHFNSLSNSNNKKAQNREVAGKSEKKSIATIWRENFTSLSR